MKKGVEFFSKLQQVLYESFFSDFFFFQILFNLACMFAGHHEKRLV